MSSTSIPVAVCLAPRETLEPRPVLESPSQPPCPPSGGPRHPAAELLELIAASCQEASLERASRQLARGLTDLLRATRVIVGIATETGQSCRVIASSDGDLPAEPDSRHRLEAALDGTLTTSGAMFEPGIANSHVPSAPVPLLEALRVDWPGMAIAGQPMAMPGQAARGALIVLRNSNSPWPEDTLPRLRTCGQVLGAILPVLIQARQNPWRKVAGQLARAGQGRRVRWFAGGLMLGCLLLAVPWPYRLSCHCTLEPVERRFVVAPFAGKLEESLVQPGDQIASGQLLARMAAHEIELELAALEAERSRAEKRHEAALATRAATAAQLAYLEMQQHDMRIRTLSARRDQLTIRSPLEGIVVRGDLERSTGAPLSVGQTLFEIAPLEKMIAEIAIPESEVANFGAGDSVELRLDAFPRTQWSGAIRRLHPRSEFRDGNSVFIAEVELSNDDRRLCPGMHGSAFLTGPRCALGWNLFHRAYDRMCAWMGW